MNILNKTMEFKPANVESDVELKKRAMDYILREICYQYKTKGDIVFNLENIKKHLQGFGREYLDLSIHDVVRGTDYFIFSDEGLSLSLKGKEYCQDDTC